VQPQMGGRAPPFLSTLEKNFCAWLRICTAVLEPMCSARTRVLTVSAAPISC